MELTEADDTKKMWQEYTKEIYKKYNKQKYTKKDLHNPDNHTQSQTSWSAKSSGPQEASL